MFLRSFSIIIILGLLIGINFRVQAQVTDTSDRQELESLIRAKNSVLEQINQQLESTRQNLESTRNERVSLQRQLNSLQSNIQQLELNIRADEITTQKLSLELDSLNYDIEDIEESMGVKRTAIGRILQELQQNENNNLLVVFLKNSSLADGFLESQSLRNLKDQLTLDITSLNELRNLLENKMGLVSDKQKEIQLRKQNLVVRKSIVEDQKDERKVVLAQTKSKESTYQQQLEELKKQQDAIEDEISRIEDQMKAKFDLNLLPSKNSGVFSWPIALKSEGGPGRITQHFGERSYLYRGKPHNGTDIGVPVGTPVFAAADGTVRAVDNNDRSSWSRYQYGRYVLIEHENNLATLYAHLSRQTAKVGEKVIRGQLIGYSGNTGYSTGPHLHFGAYWAPSISLKSLPPAAGLVPVGVVVSPEDYLSS